MNYQSSKLANQVSLLRHSGSLKIQEMVSQKNTKIGTTFMVPTKSHAQYFSIGVGYFQALTSVSRYWHYLEVTRMGVAKRTSEY